jgi:hypothetical protein
MGLPAAMSPTTGTVTRSSAGSGGEARRNPRTSSGRVIVVPRRRNPFSSRLLRCFETDEDDRVVRLVAFYAFARHIAAMAPDITSVNRPTQTNVIPARNDAEPKSDREVRRLPFGTKRGGRYEWP